jgi:hypothetical protein
LSDSDWSGRIIGYKLTPILEAENKTVIKKLTKTKKRKRRCAKKH